MRIVRGVGGDVVGFVLGSVGAHLLQSFGVLLYHRRRRLREKKVRIMRWEREIWRYESRMGRTTSGQHREDIRQWFAAAVVWRGVRMERLGAWGV